MSRKKNCLRACNKSKMWSAHARLCLSFPTFCCRLTAAKFTSPQPISMWECAAVAKRKWTRRAQPHSRHVVFSTSFVSCPPAKFRSMSMERMRRRSGADKAFSKFSDCPRKNFHHCRNLRTRKSSRFGKKICETVYAKLPMPYRRTKPVTC